MLSVKDLRTWLDCLDDDAQIGIDDSAHCLRMNTDRYIYCEIGSLPKKENGK